MSNQTESHLDKIALGLCLGGVTFAITLAAVGKVAQQNFTMLAFGLFAAFNVAALVLGLVARAQPLGKTAAITSGVLLGGSLFLLG